jgi:RNA polymerase sigma-70 factor (ECF subfamily)
MSSSIRATLVPSVADPLSFESVYREHAQTVARWARQLGGSSIDVEDVVQEVFEVVGRRLPGFRGDARLTSWLFEITRKTTANHRRRQRWRFWQPAASQTLDRVSSESRDPLAELERRQMAELFYAALDRLPDRYRTVLVLYEIDGLSTQAIAELCQRTLSTVKVQLHRARELFIARYQHILKRGQS